MSGVELILYGKDLSQSTEWVEKRRVDLPDEVSDELNQLIYRIGRSPNCEIQVDWCDHFISGYQLMVSRYSKEKDYSVRDGLPFKPSKNGTFLNGQKLKYKEVLKNNDRITVSGLLLIVYKRHSDRLRLDNVLGDLHQETLTNATTNSDSPA